MADGLGLGRDRRAGFSPRLDRIRHVIVYPERHHTRFHMRLITEYKSLAQEILMAYLLNNRIHSSPEALMRSRPLSVSDIANPHHFWRHVRVIDGDECWTWQATLKANGYGSYMIGTHRAVRTTQAHRVAYVLGNDDAILEGECIMHKCDNKQCCNPMHLQRATHSENMKDFFRKGLRRKSYPRGRTPTNAKKVTAFGITYNSYSAAAKAFGITKQAIAGKIRRKTKGWELV